MEKITINKTYHHFKTITEHKLLVTKFCFQVGLYKQGILHDLSKYSWIEFSRGARYYQGYRSPISLEKEIVGYSLGWLHHKGKYPHHIEYYFDKKGRDIIYVKIPMNYLIEMVCDRIAACMIYQKEKYTDSSALNYFLEGSDIYHMHPESKKMLEELLTIIKEEGHTKGLQIIKHVYLNKKEY